MIDLQPAPVPELSEAWIISRQAALVSALSQRRRRPVKWVVLAGATGVAATVSALVLVVGGSPQSAFAGWSPSPTPPASGQLTSADTDCQASLTQLPPFLNKGADSASLVPELSDVRGPYTLTLLGDGSQSEVLCISTPDNTAVRWIALSGVPVDPGAIVVDRISSGVRDGDPYTLVVGRTGQGVTGVTLSLGNGTDVTATSGNGVFVAWWPGSETITSAIVATATGVSTQTVNLPGTGIPSSRKSPPPPSPLGTQSSCIPSAEVACSVGTAGPS
jgi:hypothetical protein